MPNTMDYWQKKTATVLVTFNRPVHTRQVLDALRQDRVQNLYILCDAPRRESDLENVLATRNLLAEIDWTVPKIVQQKHNIGLARSVVMGINMALRDYEAVVLLEDDCVPQPHYFHWIYSCLAKYYDNAKVMGISGYTIPFSQDYLAQYPYDAYFFPRMDSWGWATWKNRWQTDNRNLAKLTLQCLEQGVDLDQGGKDVPNAIGDVLLGRVKDTWTLPWLVNVYLQKGCYIYPTVSHIDNIGMDGTGIHCGYTDKYNTILNPNRSTRLPDQIFFDKSISDVFLQYQNAPQRLYSDTDLIQIAKSLPLQIVHVAMQDDDAIGRIAMYLAKSQRESGSITTTLVVNKKISDSNCELLCPEAPLSALDHIALQDADVIHFHDTIGVFGNALNNISNSKIKFASYYSVSTYRPNDTLVASIISCPSSEVQAALQRIDARVSPHFTYPLVINGDAFRQYQKAPIRQELGISANASVVLFHNTLRSSPSHIATLLKTISISPTVHFCYVGNELQGSPSNLQYLGTEPKPDILAALYAMSDLYVATNYPDAIPLECKESLACATPIIAVRSPIASETFQREPWAFEGNYETPETLANDILQHLSQCQEKIPTAIDHARDLLKCLSSLSDLYTAHSSRLDDCATTKLINLPTEPVSRLFGFDRGKPIDRHYIEHFLQTHSDSIYGDVMEIGESTYTELFAQGKFTPWIFHANPIPGASFYGDLSGEHNLPANRFHSIICTQTLNFILEPKPALQALYNSLRPGGTLLLTVAGLSQISRYDMDRWGDYWRFTDLSLRKLCELIAPSAQIDIGTYGNVGTAKAFLDGLACEELDPKMFAHVDKDYQIIVTASITKPSHPTPPSNTINQSKSAITLDCNTSPCILLYHRVANDPIDAQLLAVSPKNFQDHLDILSRKRHCLPLADWISAYQSNCLPPGAVAITFDDGYVDNLTNASPCLAAAGMEATLFVASRHIDSPNEFWWDALEHIFLSGQSIPTSLSLTVSNNVYRWDTASGQNRLQCMDQITAYLKGQSEQLIDGLIEYLYNWSGISRVARNSHRILSAEQIRQLVHQGTFAIGSHASSHASLGHMDYNTQRKELAESKIKLESILQREVPFISYPFGSRADFNADTLELAKTCGYKAGLSNIQADAASGYPMFALPRRLVRNWNGSQFAEWLDASDKESWEQQIVANRQSKVLYGN